MQRLNTPPASARASYTACTSRVRNAALAARLAAATDTVVVASREFDREARRGRLDRIATHRTVAPDVTKAEMEKVYTQRMAKVGAPGREIYDEIFAAPPGGRCPLCVQRSVTTLDHHLPKALFPALAVAPLNLVPACSDCNKAKLDAAPATAGDVPLHPYYDDLGNGAWLVGTVVEARPAAVRFTVERPAGWSDTLNARVANHFRTLGLGRLFAAEAADELVNIRHQLTMLHGVAPRTAVKDELERRADSAAAVRPNGWRAATYRAWHGSDWFCEGGFQHTGR